MKSLTQHIQEAFKLGDDNFKSREDRKLKYKYHPKDKDELKAILTNRLEKDKNADLNDIDISEIEDMSKLFEGLDPHNIDISDWDVSKVENMDRMFNACKNFNCDISKWDTSKVKNMRYMFYRCKDFNCDLSDWNVSKVEHMESMFLRCKIFDCDLSKWNVSKVRNMANMFYECDNFEGKGLEKWNIMNVESTTYMFYDCYKLNVDLSSWPEPINISDHYDKMFTGCTLMKKTGSKRIPKWWSWVYNS